MPRTPTATAGIHRRRVRPLEPLNDARALLAAGEDRPVAPAVAVALWRASASNPLALLELPRAFTDAQLAGREALWL